MRIRTDPMRAAVCAAIVLLGGGRVGALDPNRAVTQYRVQVWTVLQGLPHNSINRITQDAAGYLVIRTFGGTASFDGVQFQHLQIPEQHLLRTRDGFDWFGQQGLVRLGPNGVTDQIENLEGLGGINSAYEAADGEVIFAGDGGLGRVGPGSTRLQVESEQDTTFHAVLRDRHGVLWAGTSRGLLREKGDQWVHHPDLGSWEVVHLAEDLDGRIWAGGFGVHVLSADDERRATSVTQIPPGQIRAIEIDRDGNVWIATAANGLVRHRNGMFERMGVKEGLPSAALRAVHEDDQGNLWIGTAGGGLVRLSDGPFVTLGRSEGLETAFVFTAIFDRAGDLWIGTNGGGVSRFREGRLVRTYGPSEGLEGAVVQSLLQTDDGRIVAGTRSGLFEKRGERFVRMGRGRETDLDYRFLFEDAHGTIWSGGSWGLGKWSDGDFTHVDLPESAGTVRSIRPAPDGGVWVCANGLILVDETGARFLYPGEVRDGVRDVFRDERGVVWLATPPGLLRIEGSDRRVIPVPTAIDEVVHTIILDDDGRFWLPTNAGLVRVERAELDAFAHGSRAPIAWRVFDESDGLLSSEFNGSFGPRTARDSEGRFWLASIRGLVSVDPRLEIPEEQIPARFESAQTGEGKIISRGERLPPSSRRRIELRFTAINLTSPEQTRFRYRLEPVDDSWTEAGAQRIAIYRNLEPGTYRFRVAAATRDRVFREDPEPFELAIEPYFWERRTVRAGSTLLVLAILFTVPFVRVRRLRQRQLELERLVEERTSQLVEANERLEETARTDPLSGVLNRRGFLDRADHELARFRRHRRPYSIVLIDLDHFKRINDVHGHAAGDAVITMAGTLLRGSLREEDIVARWGGEELILLLPETDASGARTIADKVRQMFAETEVRHGESVVRFTATLGVAEMTEEDSLEECVHRADEALYEGKASGRNRVVVR